MASRRRVVDRRQCPRFEVVGDLLGTLEVCRPLAVLNIGPGGALIHSDREWALGSVHSIVMANGNEIGAAQVRVRHVTPDSGHPDCFFIGVEFLFVSPELTAEIVRWMSASGDASVE